MENYTGIIIIKENFSEGKLAGHKAYLIADNYKNYELFRENVFELNDVHFSNFHKKKVEICGKIQNGNSILVDSIIERDDDFHCNEHRVFQTIKFSTRYPYVLDLINCEGSILSIVKTVDPMGNVDNERLYIRGFIPSISGHIYCKVNEAALLIFYQGRFTLKELFMLRIDEYYIIERQLENKTVQTAYFYNNNDKDKYIDKIHCGDYYYHSFSSSRTEDSFEEVMKKLEKFWVNDHSNTN